MLRNSQVCWIVRAELRSSCENIRMNLTVIAQTVFFPIYTVHQAIRWWNSTWSVVVAFVQISLLSPSFFFHGAIMVHSNNSLKKYLKKSLACFSVRCVLMSCPQLFLLSAWQVIILLLISSVGCRSLTKPDQHLQSAPRELWLWVEHFFFGFCFSSFFFRIWEGQMIVWPKPQKFLSSCFPIHKSSSPYFIMEF